MKIGDAIYMEVEKEMASKKLMTEYENRFAAGCSVSEAEMFIQSYSDAINAFRMHRYAKQLLNEVQEDMEIQFNKIIKDAICRFIGVNYGETERNACYDIQKLTNYIEDEILYNIQHNRSKTK